VFLPQLPLPPHGLALPTLFGAMAHGQQCEAALSRRWLSASMLAAKHRDCAGVHLLPRLDQIRYTSGGSAV
jgi:hypothetical protein